MAKKKSRRKVTPATKVPKLECIALCDSIVRDPSTSKPTLYGVFDQLYAEQLPILVRFSLFAKFTGGAGKHSINVALIGPDGKPVEQSSHDVELNIVDGKNFDLVVAAGVLATEYGPHYLRIKLGRKLLGTSYPMIVTKLPKSK